jgi:hypothetical protein
LHAPYEPLQCWFVGRRAGGTPYPARFPGTWKGLAMEKWLCWGSLGVSGILLLLFLLDMIVGIPFGGIDVIVNIIGIIACGLVGYLAFESFKDLR